MQRCGMSRWWNGLLDVWALQEKTGIRFSSIQRGICLTALRHCIRGERGFGDVPKRKSRLLKLGRKAWKQVDLAPNADDFNISLNAAFWLCAAADEPAALKWAEELWSWAEKQNYPVFPLQHQAFAQVLAAYRLHKRVDALVAKMFAKSKIHGEAWRPSRVTLGGFLNVAGEQHDVQRLRALWKMFVFDHGVQPSEVEYGIIVKGYTICGRPGEAANEIENMLKQGIRLTSSIPAQDYVQALLVVYHSSLILDDRARLKKSIDMGKPILMAPNKASSLQRRNWKKMVDIAQCLFDSPKAVNFRGLLIQWNASSKSVMKNWSNCKPGANYIERHG